MPFRRTDKPRHAEFSSVLWVVFLRLKDNDLFQFTSAVCCRPIGHNYEVQVVQGVRSIDLYIKNKKNRI